MERMREAGCDLLSYKDDYSLFDENAYFEIAITSVIGDREEQQDSSGFELKSDEGFSIVCDGMGGHNGGKAASTIATELLCKTFSNNYPNNNMRELLLDAVEEADKKVADLCDENGEPLRAGSTLVSVYIKGRHLYWISVGDSRIYIYRNSELVQVTTDHNLKTLLEERLSLNLIDLEEYNEKMSQGEALISFLGINGLPKIDANESGFELVSGDRILMMSDGLYKLLDDAEILRIIDNFNNIQEALKALELKAQKSSKTNSIKRDNMTVALIRVK